MLVKLDHFPNFRGENKKYLRCHHLGNWENDTTNWRHERNWDLPGDLFIVELREYGRKSNGWYKNPRLYQSTIHLLSSKRYHCFPTCSQGYELVFGNMTSPTLGVQCTVFFWMEQEYLGKNYEYPPLPIGRVDPKIWDLKTKSLPPYLCLSLVTSFQQLMSLLGGTWANYTKFLN